MSGASGLRPHDHSSPGQGGTISGSGGPLVYDSGTSRWHLDTGISRLYDENELAYLDLSGDILLKADSAQSIALWPNGGADGGSSVVRVEGGNGFLTARLAADPIDDDSELGQLYENSTSNVLRAFTLSGWQDVTPSFVSQNKWSTD